MKTSPPSMIRRLLCAGLPPGPVREGLVGDLDELYRERSRARGRATADVWYLSQTATAIVRFLPRRLGFGNGDGITSGAMRDLRLAARSLARSPGFTAVAGLTLALGIGTITSLFTVLEQVVLRPLPVDDQDRLVVIWNRHLEREMPHFPVFGTGLQLVEDEARSLVGVAGTSWGHPTDVLVEGTDGGSDVSGRTQVTGEFFGVLGVEPVVGRILRAEDDLVGAEPVAVISYGLWVRRYGGDPGVVGATLEIAGTRHRVIGVLPVGFGYPEGTEVWTALSQASWAGEGPPPVELDLVARLAPGATPAIAAAELDRLYANAPDTRAYEGIEPVVMSLVEVVLGDLRPALFLLFGGAVLVLLVASLNVGNLVLVRAGGREESLAVRRALGAGAARLSREALAEGAVLGALGGAGGALLAWVAVQLALPLAPPGLPRLGEAGSPDLRAYLFAGGVSSLSVLLLTLLPAVRALRVQPADVLRRVGRSGGALGRGRRLIVLAQTGLAVWALAAGVLLLRTYSNLQALDPGFQADDVTLVELHQPYPLFGAPPDLPDRMSRVAARLEALPWVEQVTSSFLRPMAAAGGVALVGRREDQSAEEALEVNPSLNLEVVGAEYFRLLDVAVIEGRSFGPEDVDGMTPVAVVNQAAARALWSERSPLGDRLSGIPRGTWWTVVGVVEDTRYQSLTDLLPTVYVPFGQAAAFPPRYLLVRTDGEGPLLPELDAAFDEVDPSIRIKEAISLRAVLEAPLARPRFTMVVLGGLAVIVLLLAGVGVYGVMAARVRARNREMGVRLALGAAPGGVRALVLREGLALAAVGALLGTGGVLLTGALLERLLFGVSAADPWSLAAAVTVVLGAATAACWIPAARAARLDPSRSLRPQ